MTKEIKNRAKLIVVTGAMFSGKTRELIRRLETAAHADEALLVVKPTFDDRTKRSIWDMIDDSNKLKDYPKLTKRVIESAEELQSAVASIGPDIVVIDEAQFLTDQSYVDCLTSLLEHNAEEDFEIIVAGLDMSWKREPFGIMPTLMCLADEVIKFAAVCNECKSKSALFTKKIAGSKRTKETGDSDLYVASCRVCFPKPYQAPE